MKDHKVFKRYKNEKINLQKKSLLKKLPAVYVRKLGIKKSNVFLIKNLKRINN